MLAPVTIVSPLIKLRRSRLLPVPGRVLVHVGSQVNPDDVVAEAQAKPRHALLDVADLLDLPRARAEQVIRCKPGQLVEADEVLAGPVGLLRDVVRAPQRSRVVVVGDGKILLQLETPPLELTADYPGEVVEVVEGRGVVIENTGSLIQGVWGNGRTTIGLLQVLADRLDHELTLEQMDISLRGQIAFAGHCGDGDVLDIAQEIGLKGLILGSMSSSLLAKARKSTYPILLLEGFGTLPLDEKSHQLLASLENREILVRAVRPDRQSGEQPELFLPSPAGREVELPSVVEYWRPGLDVRVIGGPHAARAGEVVKLLPGLTPMPSGVRVPAALVRLSNQQTVTVPLANLQVLA